MKNVDKQWNKKGCNSIDECERIGDCRDCKNVWTAGWKAALEWVLKNFDGKTDMLTLGLEISEELQE